jgi:hypothetical protein
LEKPPPKRPWGVAERRTHDAWSLRKPFLGGQRRGASRCRQRLWYSIRIQGSAGRVLAAGGDGGWPASPTDRCSGRSCRRGSPVEQDAIQSSMTGGTGLAFQPSCGYNAPGLQGLGRPPSTTQKEEAVREGLRWRRASYRPPHYEAAGSVGMSLDAGPAMWANPKLKTRYHSPRRKQCERRIPS